MLHPAYRHLPDPLSLLLLLLHDAHGLMPHSHVVVVVVVELPAGLQVDG